MGSVPDNVFVFHFTAIGNLRNIFAFKALKAKNLLAVENIKYVNIACINIQDKRARTLIPNTERTLHDYVPFYFAPRSPMLFSIAHNNVPEAEETNQDNFVYFVSSVKKLCGQDFVFTDYQAVVTYASFYNDLACLDKIQWGLIYEKPHLPPADGIFPGYCQFFQNVDANPAYVKRKEARLAEFLVFSYVPLDKIDMIVVKNADVAEKVKKLLQEYGVNITVEIKPGWYF